jgi:hypothetical protein
MSVLYFGASHSHRVRMRKTSCNESPLWTGRMIKILLHFRFRDSKHWRDTTCSSLNYHCGLGIERHARFWERIVAFFLFWP